MYKIARQFADWLVSYSDVCLSQSDESREIRSVPLTVHALMGRG